MDLERSYDSYKFNDYFKTDLPKHWLEKRLGYLAKEDRAAFVDGPFGSDLKSSDYKDSGIPLIQLNNIRDSRHLIQNMKFVTEEKKQQLIRHLAIPGDVVIAKMAEPVARSAVVADDFPEYIIVADCVKLVS
jgi:type I restriction enzyme S subunit